MKTIDQLQEEIKVINEKLNLIDEGFSQEWIALESELADLNYELKTLVEYYEAADELEIYLSSLTDKVKTSTITLTVIKTSEEQVENKVEEIIELEHQVIKLKRLEHNLVRLKLELDIINIENEMAALSESVTDEDIEKYVSLSDKLKELQVLQEAQGWVTTASESFVPEDLSDKKVLSTEIDSVPNGSSLFSLDKPQYLAGFEAISPILTTDKTNTNSDGLELINLSFKRVKTDAELAGLQPICGINTDTNSCNKLTDLQTTYDEISSNSLAGLKRILPINPDTKINIPEPTSDSNLEHDSDVPDIISIYENEGTFNDLSIDKNAVDFKLILPSEVKQLDPSEPTFNSGDSLYGNAADKLRDTKLAIDVVDNLTFTNGEKVIKVSTVVLDEGNDNACDRCVEVVNMDGVSEAQAIKELEIGTLSNSNLSSNVINNSDTIINSTAESVITLSSTVEANETIYKGNGDGDKKGMGELESVAKELGAGASGAIGSTIADDSSARSNVEAALGAAVYERGCVPSIQVLEASVLYALDSDSSFSTDAKTEIKDALSTVVGMAHIAQEMANANNDLGGLSDDELDRIVNDPNYSTHTVAEVEAAGITVMGNDVVYDQDSVLVGTLIRQPWTDGDSVAIDATLTDSPNRSVKSFIDGWAEIIKAEHPFIDPSISRNNIGNGILSDRETITIDGNDVGNISDVLNISEGIRMENRNETETGLDEQVAPADDSATAAVGPVVDGENAAQENPVHLPLKILFTETGPKDGVPMQEVEVGSGAGSTDRIVVGLDVGASPDSMSMAVVDTADNTIVVHEISNAAPANIPSNVLAVRAEIDRVVDMTPDPSSNVAKAMQDNLMKVAVGGDEGNTTATTIAAAEAPRNPTAADFINNASGNGEVKSAQVVGTGMSTMGTILLQQIEEYQVKMMPRKPVSRNDLSKNQIGLYRAITRILALEEDFNLVYTKLLEMFHEGREGVFHETHVFRATEVLELPENDRKQFLRLLNLIKFTADVKGRAIALKQIDFGRTLEFIPEIGRQKLLNYYNVN